MYSTYIQIIYPIIILNVGKEEILQQVYCKRLLTNVHYYIIKRSFASSCLTTKPLRPSSTISRHPARMVVIIGRPVEQDSNNTLLIPSG